MSRWDAQYAYWEIVVFSGSPMSCQLVLSKSSQPTGTHVVFYWPWILFEYRKTISESPGLYLPSLRTSRRYKILEVGQDCILRRTDRRELLWSLWDISECKHHVSRTLTKAIQLAGTRASDGTRPPAWSLCISRPFIIIHNRDPLVKKVSTHPPIEAVEASLMELF